mgnify:FL=1
MAANYETQKKMRAAQVGTIMPWVGDAGTKPDGWLECNGQTLEAVDYPILASVIGNTYGPQNGLNARTYGNYLLGDQFRLPSLNGRVLTDYEPTYINETSLQMGQTYPSGAVGGLVIIEGETDLSRTSQTVNVTSGTAQLVLGTGVSGTGLQLTLDCDVNGRVAVSNITAKGSAFATGDKLTIPASVFSGNNDIVIEVAWVLPSVAEVLTPTGPGTVQLMGGDGSAISPPTAMNATADLNFVVTDSQNLTGQIRSFSINPPAYFKSYYTIPRKLSKDHMPPHRHSSPAGIGGYSRADADAGFVEGFQCPANIAGVEGNQKQRALGPGAGGDIDSVDPGILFVTYFEEGTTIKTTFEPVKNNVSSVGTHVPQPCWTGPIPRALNGTFPNECNYRESSQAGFMTNKKNWYGNQTADQINQASGTSKTYPTTLNHNQENMTGSGNAINSHNHYSFEVVMNAGFVKPPSIVPVDDIQIQSTLTGQPTNVGVQNIPSALNINVDIKTPALSMMYLIRAY